MVGRNMDSLSSRLGYVHINLLVLPPIGDGQAPLRVLGAVSYTHLDVYKRQCADRLGNPSERHRFLPGIVGHVGLQGAQPSRMM